MKKPRSHKRGFSFIHLQLGKALVYGTAHLVFYAQCASGNEQYKQAIT